VHYDSRKLPLGKLSKRTLHAGFQLLKDISELVATPSLAMQNYNLSFQRAAEDLSNQYFTTIPHVFGRNRPPVIASEVLIKREVELLEALTDMEIGNEILNGSKSSHDAEVERVHELDRQFAMLDLEEMTPCSF
jgi:poly [ADP-ribose] polymerase